MSLFVAALLLIVPTTCALAQNQVSQVPQAAASALRRESDLVLVPTLVTTKADELVFSLTSQDFTVLDNGVAQKLTLDDDSSQRPLALVIVVQTGGVAAQQLPHLRHLETMIEAMVENTPHEVALVSFDSKSHLLQNFTPNLTQIGSSMQGVRPGDRGAGILDGLVFSLNLVQRRPPARRIGNPQR